MPGRWPRCWRSPAGRTWWSWTAQAGITCLKVSLGLLDDAAGTVQVAGNLAPG
jgi:hypothetical protein